MEEDGENEKVVNGVKKIRKEKKKEAKGKTFQQRQRVKISKEEKTAPNGSVRRQETYWNAHLSVGKCGLKVHYAVGKQESRQLERQSYYCLFSE